MPQPLRKTHPALDLPKAQNQVREALRRACKEGGGQSEFHRKLTDELTKRGKKPISRQGFLWWISEGTFVDEYYWEALEAASDMLVTRRHLRPDLYRS